MAVQLSNISEQLRREWPTELRRLKEWRPGMFPVQQVADIVFDKHPEEIDRNVKEAVLESLLQEHLAHMIPHENIYYIEITDKGLEYLAKIEKQSEDEKPNITVNVDRSPGSILNIGSDLDNVKQSIRTMPNINETSKKQLEDLIEQLKTELQKVPPAKQEQADTIATYAKQFVEEGTKVQPNKTTVQITATGLKAAAENIAGVMPTVLAIVKTVFLLAGIPLP